MTLFRWCPDCNRNFPCTAVDYSGESLACEDFDGDPKDECTGYQKRLAEQEPNYDNYSGPRGRDAEHEAAHRMEQARRLR
jgi:hypothetical protein